MRSSVSDATWYRPPENRCPCCGGPLPGHELQWLKPARRSPRNTQYASGILVGHGKALVLTRTETAVFDLLWQTRGDLGGLDKRDFADRMWRDREDGGPNYDNVVNQYLYHLKHMIRPFGITISSRRGPGSTTRLIVPH